MATRRQYFVAMRSAVRATSRAFGIDLNTSPKELRVAVNVLIGLLAVLVKVLVDKGVMTDLELQAALADAQAEAVAAGAIWDDEPTQIQAT